MDELAARAKSGDRQAVDELLRKHDGLCWMFATRFHKKHPYLPLDDCLQTARTGFLYALKRFDPSREFLITTYAGFAIRNHLVLLLTGSYVIRVPPGCKREAPRTVRFCDMDPTDQRKNPEAPRSDWEEQLKRWKEDDAREKVRWAMRKLGRRDRKVIQDELDGITTKQLAAKEGISRQAIYHRRQRARQRLGHLILDREEAMR